MQNWISVRIVGIISFFVLCICSPAQASDLNLNKNLIALNSVKGEQLFKSSAFKQNFWPLMIHFVTQENLTYCAVASSTMVLNALKVAAPLDAVYKPYRLFTQDNFFTEPVQRFIKPAQVKRRGVTLDELGHALATFPVQVEVVHADTSDLSEFRRLAQKILAGQSAYMIVNFARTGISEEGSGHMSPLAAYDKVSDRFLMLDVARYKYPPIWVKTGDLWRAMATVDPDVKAYRGFVIITKQ